jgi:hypothetical protein
VNLKNELELKSAVRRSERAVKVLSTTLRAYDNSTRLIAAAVIRLLL